MLITFILLSTILFIFFALVWNMETLPNAILRVFFVIMSIWGVALLINNPSLFLVNG